MRIDVARKHDNGQLKGSLIGVIVGVVLAGILLIIAVALLVFAKATSRWCFADDEEPNTKPSGPVRGGRGGGGNPQAQVYRFILSFKLNLRYYTLCLFCLPTKMLFELFILQHVADKKSTCFGFDYKLYIALFIIKSKQTEFLTHFSVSSKKHMCILSFFHIKHVLMLMIKLNLLFLY